ncbi:hypothetical protein VPH35_081269 [Triticum aestivum]
MEIGERIPASRRISRLGVFCLSLCCVASSAAQPSRLGELPTLFGRPAVPHDYLRAADVARQCRSVLSSAAELTADGPVVHDLHFAKLDWRQDAGHEPLMPAKKAQTENQNTGPELLQEATPLATFMLTHADIVEWQRMSSSLNVSGVLTLTINRNCCCSDNKSEMMDPHSGRRSSPEFKLLPRIAKLKILLEGVYTEAGGGERVLCMVGNALLPMRGGGNTMEGPWDCAKNIGDGSNNFELPVVADDNIVLILRYPKAQTLTTRAVHGEMTSTSAKSDSVYFDTVRLVSQFGGPYASYRFRTEEEDTSGCSTPLFFCDDDVAGGCAGDLHEDVPFCDILRANEHGVLAVVPNWNCDSTDEFCGRLGPFVNTTDRAFTGFAIVMQGVRCEPTSGLDGKADVLVSAVFRAMPPWEDQETAAKRRVESVGRLCMTACLGTGTGKAACQHRVSLYIPTKFSITRRGILMGQITSMDGSHFPLSYNKVEQAMELLWRTKPSRISSNLAAMSLISYPRKRAHGDTAILSQDLQLRFRVVPEWIIKGQSSERFFELQIFSIGPLVSYVPRQQQERWQDQDGVEQRQELVNVSAVLTESGGVFGWCPVMSLEGVYNPEDGRMHLMSDLVSGKDCSIELQVEYPPTKMRWLFSPSAKLPALQSFYPGTRFDGFVGQNMEGIVCLAMLSATIVAAFSQLRYMDSHPDVVPYISLAMLGAQALCYGAVLVTDARILPAWPRIHALAALLLTLRLARKVRRSRVRARARAPLEPGRVPSDMAGLHLGGLLFVLAMHGLLATAACDDAMDLYSKVGGVVVPVMAVVLALLVYVQQRWNYKILQVVGKEKYKLQHVY